MKGYKDSLPMLREMGRLNDWTWCHAASWGTMSAISIWPAIQGGRSR